MRTLSGRRFEIGTEYAPTIRDIAVGLSRIPRWAGATIQPWSVLQHSLAAGSLGKRVWQCEHGVGHPDHDSVVRMNEASGEAGWGVHGCDGCCGRDDFPGRAQT